MKKNFLYISALLPLIFVKMNGQIRTANTTTISNAANSSAFIDASSSSSYNNSSNVGKGLLYPRVNLTAFTAFGGTPMGIPTSYPNYYDGFVVYNTATSGTAGVGTTQGTLTAGFWYYENKSGAINGGTWKPLSSSASAGLTSVSAGDLSPLFTTSESVAGSNADVQFSLSNAPANTYFGNNSASAGAPAYKTASSIIAGSSSDNAATAPLTITGGSSSLIGSTDATFNINNTAALWNANLLQGRGISNIAPTNGQVLTYTGSSWIPANVASNWHTTGNTDSEITTTAETLGNTVASASYLGTQGSSDNLVIATAAKTRAVLDTNGTLVGGGSATSSFSWGNGNTVGTKNNGAIGNGNTANGQSSIALGDGNTASGDYSVAIGKGTSATSASALSLGSSSTAFGDDSTTLNNTVSGTYSSAIGFGNTASGNKNFAFGLRNAVSGANTAARFLGGTFVIGSDNNVPSPNSVVLGLNNYTNGSTYILGSNNGTSSAPVSGVIIGSSNSNTTGYVFGTGNSISGTLTGAFVYGVNGSLSSSYTSVYSNNTHQFYSQGNGTNAKIGVNTPANTVTAAADVKVLKGIQIVSTGTAGASSVPCAAAADEGAIVYVTSSSAPFGSFMGCRRTNSGGTAFQWTQLN